VSNFIIDKTFILQLGILLLATTQKEIPLKKIEQQTQIIRSSKEDIKLQVKFNINRDAYILSWKGKSNSDYFIVQKCTDKLKFKTLIKYLKTKNKKYYHKDLITKDKYIYYRIVSVDTLGQASFSNTLKILNSTN
jgi:hypothetical protein